MTCATPLIYSYKKVLSFCSVPNEKEKALITQLKKLFWNFKDGVPQVESTLCIDSCILKWDTWLRFDIRLNALFFDKEYGKVFSIPSLFYDLASVIYWDDANEVDRPLKTDYVFKLFQWLMSKGWDPMANEALNGYVFLAEFFMGQAVITTTFEKFLELGGRSDTSVAIFDDDEPEDFSTRIWFEAALHEGLSDEVLLEMVDANKEGKNWKGIREGAFFIGHAVEDVFLVNADCAPELTAGGEVSFKCESLKMRLDSGRVVTLFWNYPISYPDDQKKDKDKETSVFHYLFPEGSSKVVIEGIEMWDFRHGAPRDDAGYVYFFSGGKVLSTQFLHKHPREGKIRLRDVSENEYFSKAFHKIQNAKKLKKIRSEASEA